MVAVCNIQEIPGGNIQEIHGHAAKVAARNIQKIPGGNIQEIPGHAAKVAARDIQEIPGGNILEIPASPGGRSYPASWAESTSTNQNGERSCMEPGNL